MTDLYAQALWNLTQHSEKNVKGSQAKLDAKTAVAQLAKHLKASGRLKLLPHILIDLKKIEERELKRAPIVEVASEKESASAVKAAALQGIHVSEAKINKSLISGWRATGNVQGKETLIDNTSTRALLDLYQSVTK